MIQKEGPWSCVSDRGSWASRGGRGGGTVSESRGGGPRGRGFRRALLGCPKVWAPSVPPRQPTTAHLAGDPPAGLPWGDSLV